MARGFQEWPEDEEPKIENTNVPRRDQTCLRGLRQSENQSSLLSYGDYLEN